MLVFEICKGLHAVDANKVRRDCADHMTRRGEGVFRESSGFSHALKWLPERGLTLGEREERRVGGREKQAGRFRGEMFPGPCRLFLAQTAAPRAAAHERIAALRIGQLICRRSRATR